MLREAYQKYEGRIKKFAPLLIVMLAVLSVIWSDYRLMRIVWNAGRQCYLVNERNTVAVPVETETFRTAFTVVGKEMLSLDISVSVGEKPEGTLTWRLEAEDGKTVLTEQQHKISEVLTEDRARLSLELSKDSLKRGERYVLVTEFSQNRDISVLASEKGLNLIQYFEFGYKIPFTILIIVCSLVGVSIVWLIYKRGLKIRYFVALSLFAGFMTVFFIPPVSRDDEFRHFVRVYTLARGEHNIELSQVTPEDFGVLSNSPDGRDYIVTVPGELNEIRLLDFYVNHNDNSYHAERNQSLCLDKLFTLLDDKSGKAEVRVSCAATATRGMSHYWPQVIPVALGIQLGIRPVALYYLARMGQMLICVLFGALALKLAHRYKDMIWLLSFIPNVIVLKSCCNSDGLLIAEMMLLAAVLLWIRETGYDILSKNAIGADAAYLILTYHITKMKIPYVLFCVAMLFVMKKENFGKIRACWKRGWRIFIPVISLMTALLGSWIIWGNGSLVLLSKLYTFVPEWHMGYILEHPGYIVSLFAHEFYGQVKGLYYAVNGAAWIPYALVIVVSLLLCKREMQHWKRLIFAASFGVLVMTIILVGYTLTPPDYGAIWGVGYRYLLPFMPIGALAVPWGTESTQQVSRSLYPACIVTLVTNTCLSWLVGLNIM